MPGNSAEYQRAYRARRKAESQAAIAQNVEADLKMVGDISNRMAVGRTILSSVDVHAACDAKIAELEALVAVYKSKEAHFPAPGPLVALPPHMEVAGFCQRDGQPWPCPAAILAPPEQIVSRETSPKPVVAGQGIAGGVKPSFLAAPDEDCICGHDRHSYHLGGPCTAKLDRKRKCPCGAFQADLGFD